ncbi:heterokaryon incompatibility protein-domain-containing protein [Dendryphion nanum]|uniref:Heterokaryon incompatibility protein-domain-containing protein n=1 Tax=Dendryphion nanum TaxID=256645 RepID=A0A9P9DUY8_9PLEO|nr:heterokaryon incompatibility protein-domain-containing protein [Dendryphion nanum]
MHLINCVTMKMEEFIGREIPTYAILSHTWEDDEISYQNFLTLSEREWENPRGRACLKIRKTCLISLKYKCRYVWIDTCCIDKTNGPELSEAINSMFKWYRNSEVCFVYLNDYYKKSGLGLDSLVPCRWFTRGWTLQELIAPRNLSFFDNQFEYFGNRSSLSALIEEASRIPLDVYNDVDDLPFRTIASTMSFAAKRETTRAEDMAYCLMGLFNVNMPLLYGEGGERAFRRLQEEIIKERNDLSIFAWGLGLRRTYDCDLFARSPNDFVNAKDIETTTLGRPVFSMTNKGLKIKIELYYDKIHRRKYVLLGCKENDILHLAMELDPIGDQYVRDGLFTIELMGMDSGTTQTLYIARSFSHARFA